MKHLMTAVLATGLCISASTHAATPNLQIQPQINPKVQPQLKPGVLKPQGCPDLTIKGLSVYIVRAPTPPDVRINFMIQVHNNGNLDYRPNPHGMRMNLVLEPTAGGTRRIIDTKEFEEVKAGRGWNYFSKHINWSRSVEFPPKIVAEIQYTDPDFATDANRHNDDCNSRNNRRELSGAEVNAQIQRKLR